MQEADLPQIKQIMQDAYPYLPEETEAFPERIRLYPEGCQVLVTNEGSRRISGYVVSYPWKLSTIHEIDDVLGSLPADADTYFIHDIALTDEAKGKGFF